MQLNILPIFQRVLCYNILIVNFMLFRVLHLQWKYEIWYDGLL